VTNARDVDGAHSLTVLPVQEATSS
jgi:hypothetical protein